MATAKTKTVTKQQSGTASPARPVHLDVRINSITPNSENVRATASVAINGCFAVKGIRIMDGSRGLFISMPSYKSGNKYEEHCFPVTKEFRDQLHGAIFDAYQRAPGSDQQQVTSPPSPTDISVRIGSIRPNSGAIRAYASVNLNGSFAIRSVKVLDGPNGLSVHMPSYKSGNKYEEHCHPITKEFRQQVSDAVLTAYNQAISLVEGASQQHNYESEEQGAAMYQAM